MISILELERFAAFESLKIEFSPKINVIIGENGCGKTQLLKAAYALNQAQAEIASGAITTKPDINKYLANKLLRLFKPDNGRAGGLCNRGAGAKQKTSIVITDDAGEKFGCEISSSRASSVAVTHNHKLPAAAAVFLPTKEALSLLPAIANGAVDANNLNALFDDTVCDLCWKLLKSPDRDVQERLNSDPRLNRLLPILSGAVGGRYNLDGVNQSFTFGRYIESPKSESDSKQALMYSDGSVNKFEARSNSIFATEMTAEGFRKLGVLQRLIENGEVGLSGEAVMFWDEPESNMNPKLIKILVECIFELSNRGTQIIIATHDYVLLKWLDLMREKMEGHVKYHLLLRVNDSERIVVDSSEDYSLVASSAISDTFAELYDEDIKRALG